MVDWALKISFCALQLIQCVVAPYIKNVRYNAVCDWCIFKGTVNAFLLVLHVDANHEAYLLFLLSPVRNETEIRPHGSGKGRGPC